MVQTELDDEYLPEWMETEEMRQAMNTLRQFSENERSYQLRSCRQTDEAQGRKASKIR